MTEAYRGGNSRLLAKSLDQLGRPLAILDRRGCIVFANAAMCDLMQTDATRLVGQACSWQLAADDHPWAALMTALAPPAGALQGRITARQLAAPVVFGTNYNAQLFVPLLDNDGGVEATLVLLGPWEEIAERLPQPEATAALRTSSGSPSGFASGASAGGLRTDAVLVDIRSRWQHLDGLHALLGTSPVIQLAMTRAQLAAAGASPLLVSGPPGVGKQAIVQGVFLNRLKRLGLAAHSGQLLPVDCGMLEWELLQQMLELWTERWHSDAPPASQLLLLEHMDELQPAAVEYFAQWFDRQPRGCTVAATSSVRGEQLATRGRQWCRLVAGLSTVEIHVPPLAERREDIPVLVSQLLAASCQQRGRATLTITPEAQQLLTAFPWPHNLRELTAAIHEAVTHAVLVSAIHVNHLPVAVRSFASTGASKETAVSQGGDTELQQIETIDLDQVLLELERTILKRALQLSPRNRAQVARWLGISRARLLRRIEQLGLDAT